MKHYKYIIFDLDDTLIDNKENIKYAFKEILKNYKPYSDAEFEKWYKIDADFWHNWQDGALKVPKHLEHEMNNGIKSKEFLDWLRAQRFLLYFNNEISLKTAIELNNKYISALTHMVVPINNAFNILNYLKDKYKIIIATNGPKEATKEKLSKINCYNFVSQILSADMFGFMKPNIEFFKGITGILKDNNPNHYLIVGDSLKSDVGFGNNCKMDSCWFNQNKLENTSNLTPTFEINALIELTQIL